MIESKKEARSGAGTPNQAEETTATDNDQKFSQSNDTTKQEREQAGFVSQLHDRTTEDRR